MNNTQLESYLYSQPKEYLCVFCMVETDSFACYRCNDYDGIMERQEAKAYLGYDWFSEEENV